MTREWCDNKTPTGPDSMAFQIGRTKKGICPECGATRVIQPSGYFRKHRRRLVAGSENLKPVVEQDMHHKGWYPY